MELTLEADPSTPDQTDEAESMKRVALRATRSRDTGKLIVYVAVSSPALEYSGLVVEGAALDFEYLDGDVLVLRFELAGTVEKPWTRISCPYVVENGGALKYVALMHGPKNGPLKLAAVKIIEDG